MAISKLDIAVAQLTVAIDAASEKAYKQLKVLIEKGVDPRTAVNAIYLSFQKQTLNAVLLELMAKSFTNLLQSQFTQSSMAEYKVGTMILSQKLYVNANAVAKAVVKVLNDHQNTFINLREASLKLFSGYGQQTTEVLTTNDVLPAYLKQAAKPFAAEVDVALAKATASTLETPALRAAYLKAIKAIEQGAAKVALDKAMQIASWEKSRYLSSRIASTELSRAYSRDMAKRIKQDGNQYVQVRPSGRHVSDMCDVFIKSDPLGLGSGIYRKGEAPVPPYHPWCLCRLISLVNIKTEKDPDYRPDAEIKYFNSLSKDEQKTILPSTEMRDELKQGLSLQQILNKRSPTEYNILKLDEVF